jgi:hypothetical protein
MEQGARLVAEELGDKMQAILEVTQTTLEIVNRQPTREEFDDLTGEVRAIKLAVTHTNQDMRKLERRAA